MSATHELAVTAQALVAAGRGILAADESTPTIEKRFKSINLANTEANRRDYREMLFTAEGVAEYVSGVILYEETLRQKAANGTLFVDMLKKLGIIPGIKVDTGAKDFPGHPGEKITEGLDGLSARLKEYYDLGARFAKWRAVITITDDGKPTEACMIANAQGLARYALACQEAKLVPIVEPEVLMDGKHTIERCYEVTTRMLHHTFNALYDNGVVLEHMLLKPNMVISGTECSRQADVKSVAEMTLKAFYRHVPAAVPGIVFLSGGQSDELATAHLNAMNAGRKLPWELSFSYGRALQAPALAAWGGKPANLAAGRKAFAHRARLNSAARYGKYTAAMEKELATTTTKLASQD